VCAGAREQAFSEGGEGHGQPVLSRGGAHDAHFAGLYPDSQGHSGVKYYDRAPDYWWELPQVGVLAT